MQAILALEDGRIFRGKGFGAPVEAAGEVVFAGPQELLHSELPSCPKANLTDVVWPAFAPSTIVAVPSAKAPGAPVTSARKVSEVCSPRLSHIQVLNS